MCAAALAVTAAATTPTPLIPPVELRVTPFVTVSAVAAPAKVSVSDPLIVIVLTVVLALRVGKVAVVPITTSSPLAGTPDRLQLPAIFQSVETNPVQVFVAIVFLPSYLI
jgi:hypothetical protein